MSKAIRDTVMENEFQVLKADNNSESVCISVLMLQVPTLEVIVMYQYYNYDDKYDDYAVGTNYIQLTVTMET